MEPVFLIAVMGATGAGKSSLIKDITGIQTDVANGPESGTSEVKEYYFHSSSGQPFILLDTPGFNDSTVDPKKTDRGIVMMLKSFLKKTYGDSRKLSGLLYLHNIHDERDKGPSQRCLTPMESLCGHDLMKKIVVITTFWDEVPVQEGVEYEDRLRKKYTYKTFSDAGVKFVRWQNDATDMDLRVDSILFDLAALGSASVISKEPGHVTQGTGAREGEETSELKANQEPMVGLVEGTTQQEGDAKPQEISSETALIANLRNELGLLKERHAGDIRDFQSEIKRLKDDHANFTSHQTQLAETCETLSTTVSEVSLSLTDLRETSKQAVADLTRDSEILCATTRESHKNTLDLKAAQKALADIHLELENVKSELVSCKRQNAQMESQLSKKESELAAASSNSSLLQKAESDLALAKADLLAAGKKLAQGKHLLPLLEASPNLKLPVNSVPFSFPIQPYQFVKNVVVKSFTGTALEDGYVTEMGGRSANINNGFGDEAVYLYPRYTFDNREAISKFSLRLQYEIDKSKTDLTKGCPKPYRYLDSDRDPKFANITAISLLRSGSSQSVPEGWDGMFDLNKNRGSEFLYLVWRRMPTSVTTILPHRFVKDIVVEFFSHEAAVKPGYLEEKNYLSSNINEGFGGYHIYLYPLYTLLYEEAISGLSLILQDDDDSSKTDLAMGAPGQYRYLDIERDSDIDATKICDVMLLRSKQRVGLPQGWDGMLDLNRSRGTEFLYLVWKESP